MITETHVLVFGCPRRQQTYRALVPGPVPHVSASPTVTIPTCPGCGDAHLILGIYGHPRRPGETVDVVLPAKGAASADPTALSGRQKVSDAAIIDALGAEPVAVAELAKRLGFAQPNGLTRRVSRMNARAAAEGARPPIAVAGGGKGRPITLARPG